jgi:hypothetical protein
VYAGINGLQIFDKIRGTSDPVKVPVVLLHGAISATGTSFGPLPDLLAVRTARRMNGNRACVTTFRHDHPGT